MARIVRTHQVDEQLAGIWQDVAAENQPAADRLLLRINARLQHLAEFPLMGPLRQDIRPQCRLLIEPPYLVFYEFHAPEELIEIVVVIDGRRDLTGLF